MSRLARRRRTCRALAAGGGCPAAAVPPARVSAALAALAVALSLACAQLPAAGPPEVGGSARFERLLLISVSGLLAEDAADAALLPGLAALGRSGARAIAVATVGAPLAYPAHATLATGRAPDRHGVVADRLLGRRGVREAPFWHATRVQGASLWQALRAQGRPVAAIGWPSTVGAALPLLVPDLRPLRSGERWLGVLTRAATPSLVEAMREVPGAQAPWPEVGVRDAARVRAACRALRDPADPALLLLRLEGPAEVRARSGLHGPAVRVALARIDAQIERLRGCLRAAGRAEGAAIAVVGDRALGAVHTRIDPDTVLADAGLITRDASAATGIAGWRALARATDALATVHAVDEQAALAAREALQQAAVTTRAFRVVPAAELQARRGDPQAWFGLEALPGYVFADGVTGPLLRPAARRVAGVPAPEEPHGAWAAVPPSRPAFVLAGAGVRAGVVLPFVSQLDVAPTLAQLLGVPLKDAEGRALVGALAPRAGREAP